MQCGAEHQAVRHHTEGTGGAARHAGCSGQMRPCVTARRRRQGSVGQVRECTGPAMPQHTCTQRAHNTHSPARLPLPVGRHPGLCPLVTAPSAHHITSHHITSHHITSRHITSHHVTSRHVTSRHVTSRHVTSRHITSHHITSHHITSRHITSHHITSHHVTSRHITSRHTAPRKQRAPQRCITAVPSFGCPFLLHVHKNHRRVMERLSSVCVCVGGGG